MRDIPTRDHRGAPGIEEHLHNNYQDFQAFLDNGGKIGCSTTR